MTAIWYYMPFQVGSNMAVSTAATDIITSRSIMLKDFLTSIFAPVSHIVFSRYIILYCRGKNNSIYHMAQKIKIPEVSFRRHRGFVS